MFKKDLLEDDREVSVKSRRENTIKRIEQYERFEANCEKIKRLNKDQRAQLSREVRERQNSLQEQEDTRDLSSLPILVEECQNELSLEQRIRRWREGGRREMRQNLVRATSLPALSEEDTDDIDSVRSKRRSKSINSDNNMF